MHVTVKTLTHKQTNQGVDQCLEQEQSNNQ